MAISTLLGGLEEQEFKAWHCKTARMAPNLLGGYFKVRVVPPMKKPDSE